jgi:hypothetical protein
MAEMNSSPSFLHMIQAFLVDILAQTKALLPADTEYLGSGRTIVSGLIKDKAFRVRLTMSQFEDDMWPHIDATVSVGEGADAQEAKLDFHPDLNASGHAQGVVEQLNKMLGA